MSPNPRPSVSDRAEAGKADAERPPSGRSAEQREAERPEQRER